ncbi:hypothetical protein MXB_3293 [Myxobolus squamalis]|nr:hypothetical protein MXB_3293 [Myxobolus squamalis]
MAKRNNFVFPILYAIFPNKNTNTYIWLFEYIKTFWLNFSPTNISMVFEQAAICAISTIFSNANYNNMPDFALSARMIVNLAFVRPRDIDMALNDLSDDFL